MQQIGLQQISLLEALGWQTCFFRFVSNTNTPNTFFFSTILTLDDSHILNTFTNLNPHTDRDTQPNLYHKKVPCILLTIA